MVPQNSSILSKHIGLELPERSVCKSVNSTLLAKRAPPPSAENQTAFTDDQPPLGKGRLAGHGHGELGLATIPSPISQTAETAA